MPYFGHSDVWKSLDIFKEFDPKTLEYWSNPQGITYAEGALNTKTKRLIAIAIDAGNGATQGAIALGNELPKGERQKMKSLKPSE